MGRWSERPRAERTGRTATDRAGAGRTDRGDPVVEGLESRRLLWWGSAEFPIPTANSAPFWITAGPDATLYFTAGGANQIGEYNPATHGFTAFPIPTPTVGPSSISRPGPMETCTSPTPKTTPSCSSTRRPTSSRRSRSRLPTSGPDIHHDRSRRQSLLHRVQRQRHRAAQSDHPRLHDLLHPDGQQRGQWDHARDPTAAYGSSRAAANKIGQLNPATGVFTELPIPTANGGSTITTGSDGDLYFTEPGSNSIGQFNPTTGVFRVRCRSRRPIAPD